MDKNIKADKAKNVVDSFDRNKKLLMCQQNECADRKEVSHKLM